MALSPALAKANRSKSSVPDVLKSLLPETQKNTIIVDPGTVKEVEFEGEVIAFPLVIDIYPLGFAICSEISDSIQSMWDESLLSSHRCVHSGTFCVAQQMRCAEKGITQEMPAPSPCQAVDCDFYFPEKADREGYISLILKSGIADKLVSFAATGNGLSESFFRQHMTIQQRIDAISKIWDMNTNIEVFSEDVRKNVRKVLEMTPLQHLTTPQETKVESESSET